MKRFVSLLSIVLVLSLFVAGCPTPTSQVIEKEVVVEKPAVETVVVEKEVTIEVPVAVEVEKEVVTTNCEEFGIENLVEFSTFYIKDAMPLLDSFFVSDFSWDEEVYEDNLQEVAERIAAQSWFVMPLDPVGYPNTPSVVGYDALPPEQEERLDWSYLGYESAIEFLVNTVVEPGDRLIRTLWNSDVVEPFESLTVLTDACKPKFDIFLFYTYSQELPEETSQLPSRTKKGKASLAMPVAMSNSLPYGPVTKAFGIWLPIIGWVKKFDADWEARMECTVNPAPLPKGKHATIQVNMDFRSSCRGLCVGKQAAIVPGTYSGTSNDVRNNGPYYTKITLANAATEFFSDRGRKWKLETLDNMGGGLASVTTAYIGVGLSAPDMGPYMSVVHNSGQSLTLKDAVNNVSNHGVFDGSGAYVYVTGHLKWLAVDNTSLTIETLFTRTLTGFDSLRYDNLGDSGPQSLKCDFRTTS